MNKIEKFKNIIRFIVSIFASREFAFVYCIIGTLAQTAHTYYLIESVSSLEGFGKIFQAIGLSIFISSSLLFFTAIADNDESNKDYKRIHLAVNLFMIIEIVINLYYYASHLIIKTDNVEIFDFIFAILVSCLIPVTIKLYAGIIQAKEWFESFKENNMENTNDVQKTINDLQEHIKVLEEEMVKITTVPKEKFKNNDNNVSKEFLEQQKEKQNNISEVIPEVIPNEMETIDISNINNN